MDSVSVSGIILTCTRNSGFPTCCLENIGHVLQSVALSPYMSHQHVSASGLVPNCPGLNQILRLNCERNLDHLTWHCVSFLVVVKYSRFLWSVTVSTRWVNPSK